MSNQVINFDRIANSIFAIEAKFNEVLADKAILFQREAEFAIQVLWSNDYLQKIVMAQPQSLVDAIVNLASIGLSLSPAKKQAYLVPRKQKICLDISYIGLVELALASGSIRWCKAELVYEQDTFVLNGVDAPPTHTFNPFSKSRGELAGVYCVAKTADGDYLTDTMPIDDVFRIRDRSEAWKAFVTKSTLCPWVTDEGEMVKKTIVKRASKLWPKTDRLDKAIHYLNSEVGEGLDSINNPGNAATKGGFDLQAAMFEVDQCQTSEALKASWKALGAKAAKAGNKYGHGHLKQHVKNRLSQIHQAQVKADAASVTDVQAREVAHA